MEMGPLVVLLTIKEVAARLNKTEAAVRWMRYRGDFPKVGTVGGRLYVRESDLNSWLASKFEDVA